MLSLFFLVINVLIVSSVASIFIIEYRAATGTMFQRAVSAAHDSATMLWQYIVLFSANLLAWSEKGAEALNLPDVQSFLTEHVKPGMLATVMTGIAIVTIVARLRGLWRTS